MSNFEKYLNSLAQVETTDCREKILKNVKSIPFQKIYQKRQQELKEKRCKNEKTIGDNNLYEYNVKNIKKDKNGICKEDDKDLTLRKGLINLLSKEKNCIKFINKSPRKDHQLFFLYKGSLPTQKNKGVKEYILEKIGRTVMYTNNGDEFMDSRKFLISHNILPVFGIYSLYKVNYKGKEKLSSKNFYNIKDLYDFELIYQNNLTEKRDFSMSKFWKEDVSIYNELYRFMQEYGRNFSRETIEKIEKIKLIPKTPIKVYRGLSFEYPNVYTRNYNLGDSFDLYSLGRSMSWTPVYCIAQDFATSLDAYGMVISTVLDPEKILIDTRKIVESEIFRLFYLDQQEIITKPFNIQKKTITNEDGVSETLEILEDMNFRVKIEELIFNKKNDIISFKNYEDIDKYYKKVKYLKDISIFENTIGFPVSRTEAIAKFFNKNAINMKILPSSQKDLVLLEQQKITDPITLEEVELKDCWQFIEDGYIIPIKSALELIDKNITTWLDKESVGFKNPLSGCIYGNLVSYNYDYTVYFPQADGKLHISLMKYPKKVLIKDNEKTDTFITLSFKKDGGTYYKFAASGNDVIIYYPYTKDGKKIVMLMIDCFLKKNLFGMSKDGYVMNGRVHKKTIIENTKQLPYGYPDNGYDTRVMGELYDLGSTPYIVAETEIHRYKEYIERPLRIKDIQLKELFDACVEQ
jgi:hypothetical protein